MIHASRNWDREGYIWILENVNVDLPMRSHIDFGCLLGIVELVNVRSFQRSLDKKRLGPWAFGPYCWLIEDSRLFENPILWCGQLGVFDVPDEIVQEALK